MKKWEWPGDDANLSLHLYYTYSLYFVACQLSSDRRAASRIIGELFQGMPSNICIEKLAPILHRRDIVNDEDLGYLVGCPQPPPPNYDTEKRHYFMLTLLKAAAIPSANCIKNLYLSLLDSFELSPCSKTQRHLSVAHYLRRKGTCIINYIILDYTCIHASATSL